MARNGLGLPSPRLAVALLLSAACAGPAGTAPGGTGTGGGPAAGGADAPKESAASFTPPGTPATHYGPDPARKCESSSIINMVVDELRGAARAAGRTPPQLDGRLCELAKGFLRWDHGTPRPAVLEFASSWYGIPAAVSPPVVGTFEVDDSRQIAERVVQATGSAVVNAVYPRIGMAIQRRRVGKVVSNTVSVVVLDSPVELDPVPRQMDPNQQAKLSGKVVAGVKNPRILVSDARGGMTESKGTGEALEATVTCGERPGRIQVEIRGEYEGGTPVLASFPVACGTAPPTSVAIAAEPWPTEGPAAEQKILELVNEERTRAGLPALKGDPALADIAREIAVGLAGQGGAGASTDLRARLKEKGITSSVILQAAAAERTHERAHDRLLASPTNRANIMSPEVNQAGIGTATGKDDQQRPIVFLVELFIREQPPVDVANMRAELRATVARKRSDARTSALREHEILDESAQRYAEALAAAGGSLPKERHAELTAPLNKDFRAVTMVSGAKPEPLDFAEEPQVTAPGKSLGVGVAQGGHPVIGRNAVYVVIMVGTPRAEPDAKPAATRSRTAPGKKPAPKAPARR